MRSHIFCESQAGHHGYCATCRLRQTSPGRNRGVGSRGAGSVLLRLLSRGTRRNRSAATAASRRRPSPSGTTPQTNDVR